MRIATWNVNSVTARLPRLLDWLGTADPDVLCLQELKCSDEAFPHGEVGDLGYEAVTHCAGRWNGVAIVAKTELGGLTDVTHGLHDEPEFLEDGAMFGAPERRAIGATVGGLRVWSLYVPNGRELGHAHFAYKLQWLAALRQTALKELDAKPYVLLGDFNVAPADEDVFDVTQFQTHVTEPERQALAAVRDAGLVDVFPRSQKGGHPYTYWDYRQLAFAKDNGMRIDLVYGNEAFTAAVTDAYVDREARKGEVPSDHAPVVVDLTLAR